MDMAEEVEGHTHNLNTPSNLLSPLREVVFSQLSGNAIV